MPRLVEKLIAPLTGLTSEAIAHHRRKSRTPSPNPEVHPSTTTGPSAQYDESDSSDCESDEQQWNLDSAAEEIRQDSNQTSTIPKGNWASPASIETIVSAFTSRHPPGDFSAGSHLALPVVIPQKRPSNKARGFIQAYSPVLEDCGIDQTTWLEFLDSFHESIKVSPAFSVINTAAGVVGLTAMFVPSAAAQAVSTAITVSDMIAKETYTRSRTNTFMVEMNEKWFKPQGLYCLMITYKPESDSVVETTDISAVSAKAIITSQQGGSGANPMKSAPTSAQSENIAISDKIKHNLKLWTGRSSAVTRGEAEMPAAAPLVFPDLDAASTAQKKSLFARAGDFTADYFDRRAVAQWRAENPDAALANVAPPPEFLTARGDPTHLKQNTSLRTALTGYEDERSARRRTRRDARGDRRTAKWETMAESGRGIRGMVAKATKGKSPIAAVKRVLKPDVVYMLLVQLPSPEQLAAART